jgi:hypothetical protein
MGNRWADYTTEFFNPACAPFIHFCRGKYVPSVGNELHIYLGKTNNGKEVRLDEIVVTPLLPLEPIPVHVLSQAEEIARRIFEEYKLVEHMQRHPDANTLHLMHGAKWGYALVDEICRRLQSEGYSINPSEVACLGRGKRIPEYCLGFGRMQ